MGFSIRRTGRHLIGKQLLVLLCCCVFLFPFTYPAAVLSLATRMAETTSETDEESRKSQNSEDDQSETSKLTVSLHQHRRSGRTKVRPHGYRITHDHTSKQPASWIRSPRIVSEHACRNGIGAPLLC